MLTWCSKPSYLPFLYHKEHNSTLVLFYLDFILNFWFMLDLLDVTSVCKNILASTTICIPLLSVGIFMTPMPEFDYLLDKTSWIFCMYMYLYTVTACFVWVLGVGRFSVYIVLTTMCNIMSEHNTNLSYGPLLIYFQCLNMRK